MHCYKHLHLDTSVSDAPPETRLYSLRVKPLQAGYRLDHTTANLYSEICYHTENLACWVKVQAPISLVAQLQVAGLVDVRVEG